MFMIASRVCYAQNPNQVLSVQVFCLFFFFAGSDVDPKWLSDKLGVILSKKCQLAYKSKSS